MKDPIKDPFDGRSIIELKGDLMASGGWTSRELEKIYYRIERHSLI